MGGGPAKKTTHCCTGWRYGGVRRALSGFTQTRRSRFSIFPASEKKTKKNKSVISRLSLFIFCVTLGFGFYLSLLSAECIEPLIAVYFPFVSHSQLPPVLCLFLSVRFFKTTPQKSSLIAFKECVSGVSNRPPSPQSDFSNCTTAISIHFVRQKKDTLPFPSRLSSFEEIKRCLSVASFPS